MIEWGSWRGQRSAQKQLNKLIKVCCISLFFISASTSYSPIYFKSSPQKLLKNEILYNFKLSLESFAYVLSRFHPPARCLLALLSDTERSFSLCHNKLLLIHPAHLLLSSFGLLRSRVMLKCLWMEGFFVWWLYFRWMTEPENRLPLGLSQLPFASFTETFQLLFAS